MRLAALSPKPKKHSSTPTIVRRKPSSFGLSAPGNVTPLVDLETSQMLQPRRAWLERTKSFPKHGPGWAHSWTAAGIRPSLEVGAVHDPLERQADAVADRVLSMPAPTPVRSVAAPLPAEATDSSIALEEQQPEDELLEAPVLGSLAGATDSPPAANGIQRKCARCEEEDDVLRRMPDAPLLRACSSCEVEEEAQRRMPDAPLLRACSSCQDEELQRAPSGHEQQAGRELAAGTAGGTTSMNFTEAVQARRRAGGRPLSTMARAFLEPRLGIDLASVRVHSDARAGALAQSVGARAFTLGQHIFFAPGQLCVQSRDGMRLLAHEVAHTLQTGGDASRSALRGVLDCPTDVIRRSPEDGDQQTPQTRARTIEEMGDAYLGAHPELAAKVEALIDDLYLYLQTSIYILDSTDIPDDLKKAAQGHVSKFRKILRKAAQGHVSKFRKILRHAHAIEHKLFDSAVMSQWLDAGILALLDSAVMSQWLDAGILALRALDKALVEAQKHPQFGEMASHTAREIKALRKRMKRLKRHDFFQRGEEWVKDNYEAQKAKYLEAEQKKREAEIQAALDELTEATSYAWWSKSDNEIENEIEWTEMRASWSSCRAQLLGEPLGGDCRVYEAHIAGLRKIQSEKAVLGTHDTDLDYERILRIGGDDPLKTADALVQLGPLDEHKILLHRVRSYHLAMRGDSGFDPALVLSVVRRWSSPDQEWLKVARVYAGQDSSIAFSDPLVPSFAADVLVDEADGDPIVLANRSLWYVRNRHPRGSDLLWSVRLRASYADGELDTDFDRKYVLEVVSKWSNASKAFRDLQAEYIGGESVDSLRVENTLLSALGEQTTDLSKDPLGIWAMAFGNDISAIPAEQLDDYLRQLPDEDRRDMAKRVLTRLSNSAQLRKLASAPHTRRALATLALSLGKLTDSQHGTVWLAGLDPTGLLEGYAMLETDQKFEQQFLRKIVKAMSKTQDHVQAIPGIDGSWGRELVVRVMDDGMISVYLPKGLEHYEEGRPYFESHPLTSTLYRPIRPEANVVVIYPGRRAVRVPAFWLVRLSDLSAQQAVKTGVEIASIASPVGVEDLVVMGAVNAYKGVAAASKGVAAVAKGERTLGAALQQLWIPKRRKRLRALERGVDGADDLTDAGKASSRGDTVDGAAARGSTPPASRHLDKLTAEDRAILEHSEVVANLVRRHSDDPEVLDHVRQAYRVRNSDTPSVRGAKAEVTLTDYHFQDAGFQSHVKLFDNSGHEWVGDGATPIWCRHSDPKYPKYCAYVVVDQIMLRTEFGDFIVGTSSNVHKNNLNGHAFPVQDRTPFARPDEDAIRPEQRQLCVSSNEMFVKLCLLREAQPEPLVPPTRPANTTDLDLNRRRTTNLDGEETGGIRQGTDIFNPKAVESVVEIGADGLPRAPFGAVKVSFKNMRETPGLYVALQPGRGEWHHLSFVVLPDPKIPGKNKIFRVEPSYQSVEDYERIRKAVESSGDQIPRNLVVVPEEQIPRSVDQVWRVGRKTEHEAGKLSAKQLENRFDQVIEALGDETRFPEGEDMIEKFFADGDFEEFLKNKSPAQREKAERAILKWYDEVTEGGVTPDPEMLGFLEALVSSESL